MAPRVAAQGPTARRFILMRWCGRLPGFRSSLRITLTVPSGSSTASRTCLTAEIPGCFAATGRIVVSQDAHQDAARRVDPHDCLLGEVHELEHFVLRIGFDRLAPMPRARTADKRRLMDGPPLCRSANDRWWVLEVHQLSRRRAGRDYGY